GVTLRGAAEGRRAGPLGEKGTCMEAGLRPPQSRITHSGHGQDRNCTSARSLDLRAADYGRLAPAARMHVAERQRVAVELAVPEAVGVSEDKAPVVLAGEFAD